MSIFMVPLQQRAVATDRHALRILNVEAQGGFMPSRRARAPQIAGEKKVEPTNQTIPVKPPRRSAKADEPLAGPAVDRRKQFTGTDEPKNRTRG